MNPLVIIGIGLIVLHLPIVLRMRKPEFRANPYAGLTTSSRLLYAIGAVVLFSYCVFHILLL